MLSNENKIELYSCIKRQFPDEGLYRVSRVLEWLLTNGYSLEKLGYIDFRSFAEDFEEMFRFQDDNNDVFIEITKWQDAESSSLSKNVHPADNFFGKSDIILNDDIIEISQRSLYALTKVFGTGITVGQLKQEIYEKFKLAKENQTLYFNNYRYTFPIGCSYDGYLVNGIITKNQSIIGKSLYFAFEKTAKSMDVNISGIEPKVFSNPPISDTDKEMIYNILVRNFEFNKPYHMAAISKILTDIGVDKTKFGYFKMKELLAQMPYLKLDEEILGGVPQTIVTIQKSDNYQNDELFVPKEEEVPEGNLIDFCYLPIKPISILEKYLGENGVVVSYATITKDLNEDYTLAKQSGKVKLADDKLIFPSRYTKPDQSNIEITLRLSSYVGKKYFLYYVDTIEHEKNRNTVNPAKQLENFAFLGSWSNFLSELASKAIDEEWDFPNNTRKSYQILILYVKYTFSRLMRENKVCISNDNQFAAFNTGLADDHYDDIYACFLPNDLANGSPWKFVGFCTAASGGLGKQLVSYFNPLPQPPSYFKRNEDLLYDSTKQLHTDFDHIIIDNINRLPLQFLYDQFFDNPKAAEIVENIRQCGFDYQKRSTLYTELRTIICENSRLFLRIQNRLKDSIELAKKRVRWNYKTAVPSYFPKRDSMSLMLPLALVDEMKPDIALVVELTKSGCYQGQTILTLPQAYINARLLCRLTGDWLIPEKILTASEEQNEEDM